MDFVNSLAFFTVEMQLFHIFPLFFRSMKKL